MAMVMCGRCVRLCHSAISNVRTAATAAVGAKRLSGKVAVVTASTDGIGFAIAKRLAEDGANVVISSRKQKNVDKAIDILKAQDLSVTGLVCHVAKKEDRQKLMEEAANTYGGIDILVSNAAANPFFGPMFDVTEDAWDKIFDTNVKSTFFLCKETMPFMEKRGGGSVVIVASIAGYQPMDFLGPYSVSKTALLGLVKAMAPQCGQHNVRVNAIAPGIIKTNFSSALTASEEIVNKTLEGIPLNRLGEPGDCAGAVSFLASDDSGYITGETIVMSGGMLSRL